MSVQIYVREKYQVLNLLDRVVGHLGNVEIDDEDGSYSDATRTVNGLYNKVLVMRTELDGKELTFQNLADVFRNFVLSNREMVSTEQTCQWFATWLSNYNVSMLDVLLAMGFPLPPSDELLRDEEAQ